MDAAIDAAVAAGIARRFHGRRGLRIGGRGTIVGKLIEENDAAREES
jgi:hypothetical protein